MSPLRHLSRKVTTYNFFMRLHPVEYVVFPAILSVHHNVQNLTSLEAEPYNNPHEIAGKLMNS